MNTITLERYVANCANTRFVTFFLLNARLLLSIRLKFISSMVLTDGYVEEQKKEFQVGKRASERVIWFYITNPKIWFLLMVGHLGLTPLST